jgi:hypothetical protein
VITKPPTACRVGLKAGSNTIVDSDSKADLKLGDSQQFMYIHTRSAGKHGRQPEVLILSLDGKDTYTLDLRKLNHAAIAKRTL